jgi:hypothetical protein
MDIAVHEQPGGARQGCLSQFQIAVDFLDLNFHLDFPCRVTDPHRRRVIRLDPTINFVDDSTVDLGCSAE